MRPRQLRGFIGLAGPYDFLPLRAKVYIDMFGHTHARQERSQPVAFVNGNEPPMLLLQGGDDSVVAPDNALSLAAALRKHDETVRDHVYAGVDPRRPAAVAVASVPWQGAGAARRAGLHRCASHRSAHRRRLAASGRRETGGPAGALGPDRVGPSTELHMYHQCLFLI